MLTRRAFAGLLGASAAGLWAGLVMPPPERRIWQVPANAPVGGRSLADALAAHRGRKLSAEAAYAARTAEAERVRELMLDAARRGKSELFRRAFEAKIETLLRQDALYRELSTLYGREPVVTPRTWVPGVWVAPTVTERPAYAVHLPEELLARGRVLLADAIKAGD